MIQSLEKLQPDEKLSVNQVVKFTGYAWDTVEYWLKECGLRYEEPPTRGVRRARFIRVGDLREFIKGFTKMNYSRNDENNSHLLLLPRTNYNRAGLAR